MTDTALPTAPELIGFRPDLDVTADPGDHGVVVLSSPRGSTRLTTLSPGLRATVLRLADTAASTEELMSTCRVVEGELTAMQVPLLLDRFDHNGLLTRAVCVGGEPMFTLVPSGWAPTPRPEPLHPDEVVKLSRFAHISAEDGALRAQDPLSHLYVILGTGAAELLARLAGWSTAASLGSPALPGATVLTALGFLRCAGLLTFGGPDDDPEVVTQHVAQWSSIDLALHARSRGPNLADSYGGAYPFRDRFQAPPSDPAPTNAHTIDLPQPDLSRSRHTDMPLVEAVETRRSIRTHDDAHPLTVGALGELLYRVARTRRVHEVDGSRIIDRPYPAGGSLHELEIYPVVANVTGLERGIWRYRGDDHRLERVEAPDSGIADLLAVAQSSANMSTTPQMLLVITAHFGRVTWKYSEMAYALILKHVGVLYQSLYLTATAMGLAGCGLGGGDAHTFAAVTGRDYLAEGSVGEFLLGSPGE